MGPKIRELKRHGGTRSHMDLVQTQGAMLKAKRSLHGEGASRPGWGKFAKAPRDPYQQQQSRKSRPRGHDKETYPAHLVCKPST